MELNSPCNSTIETTDANPVLNGMFMTSNFLLSVIIMQADIFARDMASGNSCGWKLTAVFKTDSDGVVTQVSSTGEIYSAKDASLSSTSISVSAFSDHIDFNVSGVDGKTIFWGVSAKFNIC